MFTRRAVLSVGLFSGVAACARIPASPQRDEAIGNTLPSCNSIDVDQYFSMPDPSENAAVANLRLVLQEIAATPEGLSMIETIKQRFDGERVSVDIHHANQAGGVDVYGRTPVLIIGTSDLATQYAYYTETGTRDVSLQRMVVHELYHLANHVSPFVNGEDFDDDTILRNEEEAVDFTDAFMARHYNEPPRQDYANNSIHGHTPYWDFARRNFTCP